MSSSVPKTDLTYQLIWGPSTEWTGWTGKRFKNFDSITSFIDKIVSCGQANGEAIVLWISPDADLSGDKLRDHVQDSLNRYNSVIHGLNQFPTLRDIDAKKAPFPRKLISVVLGPKLKGFDCIAMARISPA
jgi:hypothetical protein